MPQAEEVAEKVAEEVAAEEQSKVFTEANIGTSLEELKEQPGGLFTEDLSLEEELTDEFMITDVRLQAELKELMARSENPVDMQKALLYLLGSPNYTEAIEKLENFTPDYDEPYLPEPERVVEGSEISKVHRIKLLFYSMRVLACCCQREMKFAWMSQRMPLRDLPKRSAHK